MKLTWQNVQPSPISLVPCVSPLKLSSLPPLFSISQDLKGNVLGVRADLASTVFGQNRFRDTPCFSLWPPSNLFSSWNLWNQPLSCSPPPRPANFFFFFFFLSLKFLITYQPWALGFLRLIPVRRRLPSAWSTRLCVPPLTFLWASFSTPTAWLRRAQATFFSPRKRRRSSKRESRRSSSANQCCSCSLPFQNVLEPSQDEGGWNPGHRGSPVLREQPETPCGAHGPGSALQTPTSVTPGRATP